MEHREWIQPNKSMFDVNNTNMGVEGVLIYFLVLEKKGQKGLCRKMPSSQTGSTDTVRLSRL